MHRLVDGVFDIEIQAIGIDVCPVDTIVGVHISYLTIPCFRVCEEEYVFCLLVYEMCSYEMITFGKIETKFVPRFVLIVDS